MKKNILIGLMILVLGSSFVFGHGVPKGYIKGAFVKYNSSSQITVTAGNGDCSANEWAITSDTTVNLSSVLPTGEDYLYIYIDHSATTYPTPTIIGDTTEPAWSDSNVGWYNGDDRCIGVVWCDSYGNIVEFHNNNQLECIIIGSWIKDVLTNGNPNSSFQTVESTAYIPINANAVFVNASNTDTDGVVYVHVAPYESSHSAVVNETPSGYAFARGWLAMERGWSRDLKWYGYNNDDNSFNIKIFGFRIER